LTPSSEPSDESHNLVIEKLAIELLKEAQMETIDNLVIEKLAIELLKEAQKETIDNLLVESKTHDLDDSATHELTAPAAATMTRKRRSGDKRGKTRGKKSGKKSGKKRNLESKTVSDDKNRFTKICSMMLTFYLLLSRCPMTQIETYYLKEDSEADGHQIILEEDEENTN
jgi:hypothetical protein